MPWSVRASFGPIGWSRRIGGGRRRRRPRSTEPGPAVQAAGAELDRLAARIDAWGDEGARREQERRAARGELDPPTVPSFRAVAMPEGSFAQMVANRRARLGRKPKRG